MEINKRAILWIVFSVSLVLLWNQWMVSKGNPSFFAPSAAKQAPAAAPASAPAALAAASAASAAAPAAAPAAEGEAAPLKTEVVTITTDVFKVDIDTAGGVIKRLELLNYKRSGNPGWFNRCFGKENMDWCKGNHESQKNEVLFDVDGHKTFLARTGLAGVGVPNHRTAFVAKPGARVLDGKDQIQLVLEAEQGGVKLTKTFTFKKGDYTIGVQHDVTNLGTAAISPTLYLQLVHDGNKPAESSYFYSSYTGPTLFTDEKKYEKLEFQKIAEKKAEHATQANNGWIAIVQHFFVSAFVPQDKAQREFVTEQIEPNIFAITNKLPMGTVAPGQTISQSAKLYSGPQVNLDKVAPELDLVKDYGWLTIIAKPIFAFMNLLHAGIGNWGWTIVALTVIIKLAFFPLSAAGFKSTAKMKTLMPKINALREKHKNDPQKLNMATMELYKAEKINPLGGCLPILVQMPVFFALYWVLQASVEMRGAPWLGWITDLTQPDTWAVLPVIYAISMFITTKLNPAPADPMQAKMMMWMPLMFSVMFFFFPSGLVLYWVVNNILSIGQQWYITKKYGTQ
ncbi:membrane protein insertase YidC [Massilia sp. TS11]|uniref:membrane protein insertase YidC n=1 Tax=Massilia sp. TS11 TaxID=2908003 RepID=UPI001EDBC326|nr:membrane protein insertase YidC [Massilia sp. TS11]MCG2586620.1 membrane protein insertase YidC [Massilia sp. TS11]